MALVFQFGSNVRYDRLNPPQRLNGDARLVDVVCTREAFELDCTVWSEAKLRKHLHEILNRDEDRYSGD